MTPKEIVTVDDRSVYVYGNVMCTWLAKAEARSYAEELRGYIARAQTEEREACAQVAAHWHEPPWTCGTCGGDEIAGAIRART